YEHSTIGYNYRLSNLCAAIGRGQMEVLDERVAQRRHNFHYYQEALSEIPEIHFLPEPEGAFSNRWLSTILVDEKLSEGISAESIRMAMDKMNIECRPLWKPMHAQLLYKDAPA